jgi:hypothetical protein
MPGASSRWIACGPAHSSPLLRAFLFVLGRSFVTCNASIVPRRPLKLAFASTLLSFQGFILALVIALVLAVLGDACPAIEPVLLSKVPADFAPLVQ